MVRRENTKDPFLLDEGWSRISIADKSDPIFQFYVSAIFEDRDNFVSYDKGLLTFVKVKKLTVFLKKY